MAELPPEELPGDPATKPPDLGGLLVSQRHEAPVPSNLGTPPSSIFPPPPHAARPPGPGLPEAIVWTACVLPVQFIAMVSLVVALGIVYGLTAGLGEFQGLLAGIDEFLRSLYDAYLPQLLAGAQSVFVLVTLLAVALRFGKDAPRRLALRPLPLVHCGLILLLIVPLAFLSGRLFSWSMYVWQEIVEQMPQLAPFARRLDQNQAMLLVESLAETAPLWILLVIVAIAPAIAEELVFRGVIGRGLVARWGVPAGIVLTSLLFAVVHLHPAHALALLPLAVAIHWLYLATRSFWAPVLVHFLNNAWATVVVKFQDDFAVGDLNANAPPPPILLAAGLLCVATAALLIWKKRVQYYLPDGSTWNPGYASVEQPPRQLAAVAKCGPAQTWQVALALASFMLFLAVFAYTAVAA